MPSTRALFVTVLPFLLLLDGCASTSEGPPAASGPLLFVDAAAFDRDLARRVASSQASVDLRFFSPVSPNRIPERLQTWLGAVERHGGMVDVQAPVGELTPRSPALIVSLLGTAWTGIKLLREMRDDDMHAAVRGRDAVLVLERDPSTQVVVVGRIEFRQRLAAAPSKER